MEKCADIILNRNRPCGGSFCFSGITNLLIELATGVDATQRAALLAQVRDIEYAIINQLSQAEIISQEIKPLIGKY